MTARKKKEFSDIESLEQSLTEGTLEINTTCPSAECRSDTFVETSVEEEEGPEPISDETKRAKETKVETLKQEPETQPVQVKPRPPAPTKRKPSKNTPKFSFKFR